MAKNSPNTAFRLSPLDKAALIELADRLEMSRSKTIRVLVREALAILKERDSQKQKHVDETTPTPHT